MSWNLCSIDGCEKKARRRGSHYCEMHHTRWRKTGSYELKSPILRSETCKQCHQEFKTVNTGRILYCGPKCRTKARYQRITQRGYVIKSFNLKCAHCESEFQYDSNGINLPKYCSDFCRTKARHSRSRSRPLCVVEGCLNPRVYSAGICNSCYYRLRRTGTLDKKRWAYRSLCTTGYIKVFDKAHPLATPHGDVFEHRKVLYDAIGPGIHSCYWCGAQVTWSTARKAIKGSLVPDHLDCDKTNNNVNNLVPSCNRCNAARGSFQSWVNKHSDDPWLWKMFKDFGAKESNRIRGPQLVLESVRENREPRAMA